MLMTPDLARVAAEPLLAMGARLDTLETMFLAVSTTLPNEKLAKLDEINSDEAQKNIQ